MNNSEIFRKQIQVLIGEIETMGMGIAIPGSIHTMYLRCGKKQCRCHQSDENWHGPYYLWYRRVDGKLKTKSISENDVGMYQQWIANREKLETCVQKIIRLGESYAVGFKKMLPEKSKKGVPSKRGK